MPITLQGIFNAAWQKFIVEDALPAVELDIIDNEYNCRYLTADGRKCAIGLCIPDGHPAQKMGESTASVLIREFPELWISDLNKNHDINDFQYDIHDNIINIKTGQWKIDKKGRETRYREIAQANNLTIPGETR